MTQALKALGKHNIDEHMIRKLREQYQSIENSSDILTESQHGTVWILEMKKAILSGDEKE